MEKWILGLDKKSTSNVCHLTCIFSFACQDIVIGTPGRLKDLIEMGICCLKEASFVVSGIYSGNVFSSVILILFLVILNPLKLGPKR